MQTMYNTCRQEEKDKSNQLCNEARIVCGKDIGYLWPAGQSKIKCRRKTDRFFKPPPVQMALQP